MVVSVVARRWSRSAVRYRRAERLTLQGAIEPGVDRSVAALLDPRLELVSFVGRQAELAELRAWCTGDGGAPLRLVTGPGGVGKTRLAVELARQMTAAGWWCERVPDGREAAALSELRALTSRSALLLVDEAQARVGLRPLLAGLAHGDGSPVRVLLLAPSAGDWWGQLGLDDAAVWELATTARSAEIELSPTVDAGLSDSDIVDAAVRSFALELRLPERTVEISGDAGASSLVLDLHAAALVAVLVAAAPKLGDVVRVDPGSALAGLLRDEQSFWYTSAVASGLLDGARGLSQRSLRQIPAVNALLPPATDPETTPSLSPI